MDALTADTRREVAASETRLGERISDLSSMVAALSTSVIHLSRSVGHVEGAQAAAERRADAA